MLRGEWKIVSTGAVLDHVAVVHHQHLVGDLRDDAHVVGDEQHRQPVLDLQPLDQPQDLRLRGDVERGGRLVGDQQFRPAGERHRDHRALPHAAAELERIAVERGFGDGISTCRSSSIARRRARLAVGQPVRQQRLGDLLADRWTGLSERHRLLEDHRDVAAADRAHLRAARMQFRDVDRWPIRPCRYRIWPPTMRPGGPTICRIERAVMLLPLPLSPTMHSVRPRCSEKLTSSTAPARSRRRVGNTVFSPRTSSSVSDSADSAVHADRPRRAAHRPGNSAPAR